MLIPIQISKYNIIQPTRVYLIQEHEGPGFKLGIAYSGGVQEVSTEDDPRDIIATYATLCACGKSTLFRLEHLEEYIPDVEILIKSEEITKEDLYVNEQLKQRNVDEGDSENRITESTEGGTEAKPTKRKGKLKSK